MLYSPCEEHFLAYHPLAEMVNGPGWVLDLLFNIGFSIGGKHFV